MLNDLPRRFHQLGILSAGEGHLHVLDRLFIVKQLYIAGAPVIVAELSQKALFDGCAEIRGSLVISFQRQQRHASVVGVSRKLQLQFFRLVQILHSVLVPFQHHHGRPQPLIHKCRGIELRPCFQKLHSVLRRLLVVPPLKGAEHDLFYAGSFLITKVHGLPEALLGLVQSAKLHNAGSSQKQGHRVIVRILPDLFQIFVKLPEGLLVVS